MRISDWSSDVCSSDLTRDPQYAAPDGRWVSPSALPILRGGKSAAGFGGDRERALALGVVEDVGGQQQFVRAVAFDEGRDAGRSEERRVGKECGSTCSSRWSEEH